LRNIKERQLQIVCEQAKRRNKYATALRAEGGEGGEPRKGTEYHTRALAKGTTRREGVKRHITTSFPPLTKIPCGRVDQGRELGGPRIPDPEGTQNRE
jgi:hypothetical protein